MRDLLSTGAVLALVLSSGCNKAGPGTSEQQNLELRRELLAMCDVDQKIRQDFSPNMSEATAAEMQAVDAKHTARMRTIIAQHGWPGRSLVGADGAHAAWLLVQHAESSFMEECLPLMEGAVKAGDASEKDYAYLLDRVRMRQGKPQVYGTQFTSIEGGPLVLYRVEDAEHVDDRRRAVGLPPMAEQMALIGDMDK